MDCGLTAGICYEPSPDMPEAEAYNLGGSQGSKEIGLSYGRPAHRFRQHLRDLIITTGAKVCGYESPVPPARKDRFGKSLPAPMPTLRVLFGMPWAIEELCYEMGVTVFECHIQTVRRHVCGNGSTKKDEVPRFVRSLLGPIDLPTLDASDAAAGWLYMKALYSPGYFPPGSLIGKRP